MKTPLDDKEIGELYELCRQHSNYAYGLIRRLHKDGVIPDPPFHDQPPCIFSGDHSVDMWAAIKDVQYEQVHDALYLICCRLQEFESKVHASTINPQGDPK